MELRYCRYYSPITGLLFIHLKNTAYNCDIGFGSAWYALNYLVILIVAAIFVIVRKKRKDKYNK
jgi:hypothetical protein